MKRSKFSLSHTRLLSCDMGELVPVGLTEVLPGDTVQQASTCLVRMAPMLAPVMHPVHVSLSHWFVPHRLVWTDWENFITGGPDGLNASVFPFVRISGTPAVGSLTDYLGVPAGKALTGNHDVSALPFRAYALIWNEWFRDQDLQTALTIDLTDGQDTTTNTALQRVAWAKDYFTSARPWEQKGPTVTVPIGTTAPVLGIGIPDGQGTSAIAGSPRQSDGTVMTGQAVNFGVTVDGTELGIKATTTGNIGASNPPAIFADLSDASAVTVNVLREALAIQRFEEARARYGSRYTEYLRYLGVRSSDGRLQRPEFLGGGRYPIQFSEVLQTAEGTDPVGTMAGHGLGVARSNRYRRFFEEHGYVISLMAIKPKAIYTDGLERTWSRTAKEDFFQKELQHIGQQAVMNKEVYMPHATPGGTFGFQDRYDEYRSAPSTVHGEFRTTLDFWHFARSFASAPALNASFVSCVPTEDPFAVPSTDVCWVMVKNSIQARRLLAKRGTSFIY